MVRSGKGLTTQHVQPAFGSSGARLGAPGSLDQGDRAFQVGEAPFLTCAPQESRRTSVGTEVTGGGMPMMGFLGTREVSHPNR